MSPVRLNSPPAALPPAPGATDRKQAILHAAQDLYARYGYRGVALRDIAREAGVSLTLLNHHFGAKHQLFQAVVAAWAGVVEHCIGELRALATAASPPDSVAPVVDALLTAIRCLIAHPQGERLMWLHLRSRHDDDALIADSLRALFLPLAQAFVAALARCAPQADPDRLAWAYLFARGALLERAVGNPQWRAALGVSLVADPGDAAGEAAADEALRRFLVSGVAGALALPTSGLPDRPDRPGAAAAAAP